MQTADTLLAPNAAHLDVWERIIAEKYLRFRDVLVDGAALHGAAALRRFPVRPGDQVLDVGCGLGDSSIDLARAVGPTGRVVGLDGCNAFLEVAREAAAPFALPQLSWVHADAQDVQLPGRFDMAFARFGTMFFDSPIAAFANIRAALKPGGRFVQCVWGPRAENPWLEMGKPIAAAMLPPVPDDADTCGPGPFSLSKPAAITWYLAAAGFEHVEVHRSEQPYWIGDDVDEAVALQLAIGPAAEQIRTAGALGEARRDAIVAALREALVPFLGPDGVILPSVAWVVTAQRPE